MPAAASAVWALASSPARVISRYPAAAARTSASACRAIRSTSAISVSARCGSRLASRPASSALTATTVSEWPRMSCRSRANRLRWSARASRVISLRAATSCALRWITWPTPHAARADTKIWKAMAPVDRPAVHLPGNDQGRRDAGGHHGPAHAGGQQEHGHHGHVDEQAAGRLAEGDVREQRRTMAWRDHHGQADPAGQTPVRAEPRRKRAAANVTMNTAANAIRSASPR